MRHSQRRYSSNWCLFLLGFFFHSHIDPCTRAQKYIHIQLYKFLHKYTHTHLPVGLLFTSHSLHLGEPLAAEEVPISVRRALPCLYKYEEQKPMPIEAKVPSGSSEPVVETCTISLDDDAVVDTSIVVSLMNTIVETAIAITTATAKGTETGTTIDTLVEVEEEENCVEMVVDGECPETEIRTGTESGPGMSRTLPAPTSFPVSTSTSIPNSNSKRKRITPTVVSSVGIQLYSGNMMTSSNSSSGSIVFIDSGNSSNSKSGNDSTIPDIKECNAVSFVPSPSLSTEIAFKSDTPHSASKAPKDSLRESQTEIVFPLIAPLLISSNSTATVGMEIKKVLTLFACLISFHLLFYSVLFYSLLSMFYLLLFYLILSCLILSCLLCFVFTCFVLF